MRELGVSFSKIDALNLQQFENHKITKKSISNAYSVNRQFVNSKQYHDRFENLTGRKQVDENIYQQAKRLLEDRDGQQFERMIIVDARTGELLIDNISNGVDKQLATGLSKEQYDMLQEHVGEFIIIHNHPGGTRPSGTDILTLWREKKAFASVVVGHGGEVYLLSDINRNIPLDKIYETVYNENIADGIPSVLSKRKATDRLYNVGAFRFLRRC